VKDVYDAYDLTINARLPGTATLQGGVDLARRSTKDCVAVDSPQLLYCKSAFPFLTQWKLLGSVQLPVRLRLSGTFQRVPGPVIAANYSFRSNEAIGLGRSFAAGSTATRTVQIIEPGRMYDKPFHQLDLRLTRRLQVRRHRVDLMADLYNVLNSNGIIRLNTTWGQNWLRPTQILEGRLFKIGAQWDF
jgi:hypothetical protein